MKAAPAKAVPPVTAHARDYQEILRVLGASNHALVNAIRAETLTDTS